MSSVPIRNTVLSVAISALSCSSLTVNALSLYVFDWGGAAPHPLDLSPPSAAPVFEEETKIDR